MEELDIIFDPVDITVENVTIDNIDAQQIDDVDIDIDTPFIIQTDGLSSDDALVFLKDLAEGKRKIAKALTQKYEPTNEYETFDEMAEKIKTLPLEIREDIAQPYAIVWNEMLKAFAKYGGEGVYCCAMELMKWSYDNDDKITLAGADAYYTSDGMYLTEDGEYQFNDLYADNAMRYVIYFFDHKDYTIPLNLPAVAVTNIYCLNGCSRFPIGNLYTNLFGIYSYTRDKYTVVNNNDLNINGLNSLVNCILCGIEEMRGGQILQCNKIQPQFPDLKKMNGGSSIFNNCPNWYNFEFPKLEYVRTNYFCQNNNGIRVVRLPELVEMGGQYFFTTNTQMNYLRLIDMPKLEKYSGDYFRITGNTECTINVPNLIDCSKGLIYAYSNTAKVTIKLGNQRGTLIKMVSGATTTSIVNITIEKGFATPLDLTGCNGLSKQCVLDIFENLADLTEEGIKLNIIFGSATANAIGLTEDDYTTARVKGWTIS